MPVASTSFVKRRDAILQVIGFLVVGMQQTEDLINTTLQLALPDGQFLTLDGLMRDKKRLRKATLGRLITVMKQRTALSPDFEEVLEAYLEDRNILIHDLGRMGGFDYKSKEGLDRMERFLGNLNQNYEVVTKVFLSLLWEWSGQVGISAEMNHERVKRVLGDLDGVADHVFLPRV